MDNEVLQESPVRWVPQEDLVSEVHLASLVEQDLQDHLEVLVLLDLEVHLVAVENPAHLDLQESKETEVWEVSRV